MNSYERKQVTKDNANEKNFAEKNKNLWTKKKEKELLGGELNPGHSRDRRIYLTTILPRRSISFFRKSILITFLKYLWEKETFRLSKNILKRSIGNIQ